MVFIKNHPSGRDCSFLHPESAACYQCLRCVLLARANLAAAACKSASIPHHGWHTGCRQQVRHDRQVAIGRQDAASIVGVIEAVSFTLKLVCEVALGWFSFDPDTHLAWFVLAGLFRRRFQFWQFFRVCRSIGWFAVYSREVRRARGCQS